MAVGSPDRHGDEQTAAVAELLSGSLPQSGANPRAAPGGRKAAVFAGCRGVVDRSGTAARRWVLSLHLSGRGPNRPKRPGGLARVRFLKRNAVVPLHDAGCSRRRSTSGMAGAER